VKTDHSMKINFTLSKARLGGVVEAKGHTEQLPGRHIEPCCTPHFQISCLCIHMQIAHLAHTHAPPTFLGRWTRSGDISFVRMVRIRAGVQRGMAYALCNRGGNVGCSKEAKAKAKKSNERSANAEGPKRLAELWESVGGTFYYGAFFYLMQGMNSPGVTTFCFVSRRKRPLTAFSSPSIGALAGWPTHTADKVWGLCAPQINVTLAIVGRGGGVAE
jgi:hypothetical protein